LLWVRKSNGTKPIINLHQYEIDIKKEKQPLKELLLTKKNEFEKIIVALKPRQCDAQRH